ncbi:kinase-like protein [Aureobasidium pullulans]|uniref:ethanolamine kinase n=1 Tax=Aureobasidium pullulans TaxID=5580 RepID=A0A4S8W5E8_AURPU|nr:kinase-like protein [Aureobasidium pullulans]THY08557.1 kinase-like protein [Aureobasidium pullulans]THY58959.1 kinase-like protein [Aureobasidium pullulans]
MDLHLLRADSPMAVRHIDLCYDHTDSTRSALRLIYTLCPDWEHSEGPVELIPFTEGITNTLMKAIKKRPGYTQQDIDADAILLRAYGKGTDVLIDRERETRSHSLLAGRGLAPPLFARFENGLLYKYIAGDVCSPEDLRRPDVYRAVARRLGQWHSTLPIAAISSLQTLQDQNDVSDASQIEQHVDKAGNVRPKPSLWTVMQEWIHALPVATQKEKDRKDMLQTELTHLSHELGSTPGLDGYDYIFAHCDLLSGNVIVHPGQREGGKGLTVSFIDYEYATPAPAAFDIANHFAEWGGFDCDYTVLPTRSQRADFITQYLASYRNFAPVSDSETMEREKQQLIDQVDTFRGLPGFYWGIWALIQATISQIDFDYASYAEIRLGEYWAWKAEQDGSREREGRESTLREKRWAEE